MPRLIYIPESFLDDTHKRGVAYISVLPLHDLGMLRATGRPWVTRVYSAFSKSALWHEDLISEYGYLHDKSRLKNICKLMESFGYLDSCSTNHEDIGHNLEQQDMAPCCRKPRILIGGIKYSPYANHVLVVSILTARSTRRPLYPQYLLYTP